MTFPPPHANPLRRWLWLGAAIGVVALAAGLHHGSNDAPVTLTQNNHATGYRIEDGVVAWRPMSQGDQIIASLLTLGLAANSQSVRGKSLPLANAASFRTMSWRYGLDGSRVWFEGDQIIGADPASFAVLAQGFSHDAAQMWKDTTPVMALQPGMADSIAVYSDRIFAVAGQAWLTATPLIALPELPTDQPQHSCRDWFTMNGALWLGAQKLLPAEAAFEVLSCDDSVMTRYTNNQPREDMSANDGILVRAGLGIWRLGLTGDKVQMGRMPEPLEHTLMIGNDAADTPILLAQGISGMVYALALQPQAKVQALGHFASLPAKDDVSFDNAFVLGGRYFMPSAMDAATLTDLGPAERLGDLTLAQGVLFNGAQIVARPGDLPLRAVNGATVLVGAACINFGHYVTDVRDLAADEAQITAVCQTMHPPAEILYGGLRIRFSPLLANMGPAKAGAEFTQWQLGAIGIENISETPQILPADFLKSLDLRLAGQSIDPPDGAWPVQGLTLAPGASHSWTFEAQSDADPHDWNWTLWMRHTAERAAIFGDEAFAIGEGRFFD